MAAVAEYASFLAADLRPRPDESPRWRWRWLDWNGHRIRLADTGSPDAPARHLLPLVEAC